MPGVSVLSRAVISWVFYFANKLKNDCTKCDEEEVKVHKRGRRKGCSKDTVYETLHENHLKKVCAIVKKKVFLESVTHKEFATQRV